jgi:hypothetical protein
VLKMKQSFNEDNNCIHSRSKKNIDGHLILSNTGNRLPVSGIPSLCTAVLREEGKKVPE